VIAFDSPRGPAEVIRDRTNGLLIENDHIRAFRRGLLKLVEDAELRPTLGRQALADAHRYTIDQIAANWGATLRGPHRPGVLDELRPDPAGHAPTAPW